MMTTTDDKDDDENDVMMTNKAEQVYLLPRQALSSDDVRSGLKSGRKVLLGWRRDGH